MRDENVPAGQAMHEDEPASLEKVPGPQKEQEYKLLGPDPEFHSEVESEPFLEPDSMAEPDPEPSPKLDPDPHAEPDPLKLDPETREEPAPQYWPAAQNTHAYELVIISKDSLEPSGHDMHEDEPGASE